MGDPLSDPRAIRLLSAEPGEVSVLAGDFRRVATQAETAANGLRGAQHDATWTGAAADAFRHQLGKLPGDLDQVQRSYADVATALDVYESQLAPLRSQFKQLATQISGMRGSLSTAQGTLGSAQSGLTSAAGAPHAKPSSPAVVSARNQVNAAQGTVNRLQGELSGLEGSAYRILDEFDTARGHARSVVSHAAGIAPHESWLSGFLHSVGNFVGGVFVNIGKSVWDLVSGKAIINFIEHPSWSTFGTLVKDVAVTASLVAMVAAPFAAPELAEADALAAGAEGAAGEGEASAFGVAMRGATTWGGRVSTGATVGGGVSDGAQGHWGAAALDAGFLVAPNLIPKGMGAGTFGDSVSNLLRVGDHQAEESASAVETLNEGTRSFGLLESWGLSDTAAASLAFPPQTFADLGSVDSGAVQSALRAAHEENVVAARRAMHIGVPLANALDNLVTDPTHEAINHRLHLTPSEG